MQRALRNLAFFLLGVLLVGVPMLSFAQTSYPATLRYAGNYATCTIHPFCATPAEPCQKAGANGSDLLPPTTIPGYCMRPDGTPSSVVYVTKAYACLNGGQLSGTVCKKDCPIGEILGSDGTCAPPACPDGYERGVSGQCVPSCVPPETRNASGICEASCSKIIITSVGSCVAKVPCGSQSSIPFPGANSEFGPICSDQKPDDDKCPPGGIVIGTYQGKPLCLTPQPDDPTCTGLGGSIVGTVNGKPICSQPNNPRCPDGSASIGTANGQPVCNSNCPAGQAEGTVNGVKSCYPVGPTTPGKTDQPSTPGGNGKSEDIKSSDPNAPGQGKTESDKATTCTGDRCTTKEEKTLPNGVKESKVTEQSKEEFCTQNPKSKLCTGTTDSAQFCKENPDSVQCLSTGTFDVPDSVPTKSIGISNITPAIFASNASCPADVQLPKGAVLSYSSVCQYAEALRPLVLLSAWLAAGFFVLGFRSE